MHIELSATGGEQELRSLHDWLLRDSAVRQGARVGLVQAPPQAGHMGSVMDVLELVTGNAWSAAAFVVAVSTWRRTRPGTPSVTVRRRDGLTVTVDGASEEQLRALRDLLTDFEGEAAQNEA